MTRIDTRTRLTLASDTRHRRVGDEGVVLRQNVGEIMIVNEVGIELLDRIDGDTTIGEIVDGLEHEYDVEPAGLQRDVFEYLRNLLELRVVEIV